MVYRVFISLVISVLFSTVLNAAEMEIFDQSFGDFTEEIAQAKEEKKSGILIFFEMDDCPFCHRMKSTILNQADVITFYKKHFKVFQIDIEGDIEIVDFQGKMTTQKDFALLQNRVRATPVLAFFDLQGNRVVRYTGATSSKKEFLQLGEYVVNKVYTKMSFTRYKRSLSQRTKTH